jgi:hypothetical protein
MVKTLLMAGAITALTVPALAADVVSPKTETVAEDLLPAIKAALNDTADTVPCGTVDAILPGPREHPAYDVVSVLCDREGSIGTLITVRLFRSGRAAVRTEGTVSLSEGDPPFHAF